MDSKTKQLYDALVADGADVGTEQEFHDYFYKPGKEGYHNRLAVWEAFRADGADVGETYEEFRDWLGLRAVKPSRGSNMTSQTVRTSQTAATQQQPASAAALQTQTGTAAPAPLQKSAAVQATTQPVMQDSPRQESKNEISETNEKVIYGEQKGVSDLLKTPKASKEESRALSYDSDGKNYQYYDFADKSKETFAAPRRVLKNPDDVDKVRGKVDPYGSVYEPVPLEEVVVELPVEKRIESKKRKREELLKQLNARGQALDREAMKSTLGDRPRGGGALISTYNANSSNGRYYDDEWLALKSAIDNLSDQITLLERSQKRKDGDAPGFFSAMNEELSDMRNWDFGATSLINAAAAVRSETSAMTEAAKEAHKEMLSAIKGREELEAIDSNNANTFEKGGRMFGQMLPFMRDFFLMGPLEGAMVKGVTRETTKALVKNLPKLMESPAGKWTIKMLGTVPADAAFAGIMTGGLQGANTLANIVENKRGKVISENGSLRFEDDKSWLEALYNGIGDRYVENISERSGVHIEGITNYLKKIFAPKKLSSIFSTAQKDAFLRIREGLRKRFGELGMSDIIGEASEEYVGQGLRTALGLDAAYAENEDGSRTNLFLTKDFHKDIWTGMALSMGFMNSVRGGFTAASYYESTRSLNKANKDAEYIIGAKRWESIRNKIDETSNDEIGNTIEEIESSDLNKAEKQAAKAYVNSLMYARGVNLGALSYSRDTDEGSSLLTGTLNAAYERGQEVHSRYERGDAEAAVEMDAISRDMNAAYDALEEEFGAEAEYFKAKLEETEDPLDELDNPELTDGQREAIVNFVNARAALQGALDASEDAAADKREAVKELIERQTHRKHGMIIPATMKIDDRQVYIVKGDVVMFPDGSGVDSRNSSDHLLVVDAQTGKLEFAYPGEIMGIGEEIDPQQQLEAALQQIEAEKLAMFDGVDESVMSDESEATGNNGGGNIPAEANNGKENAPAPNVEEYDRGYEEGIEVAENLTDERLATYVDALREGTQKQMQEQGRVDDYIRGRLEALEHVQQERATNAQHTNATNPIKPWARPTAEEVTADMTSKAAELTETYKEELEGIFNLDDDAFEEALYEFEGNLPRGYETRLDNEKGPIIVVGTYREPNYYSQQWLDNTLRKWKKGDRGNYTNEGDYRPFVVIDADSDGKITLAIDPESRRPVIKEGRILSRTEIIDLKPIPEAALERVPTGKHGEGNIPAPDVEEYDRGYEEGIEVANGLDDATLNNAIEDLRSRDFLSDEWRGRLEAYEHVQQERANITAPNNEEAENVGAFGRIYTQFKNKAKEAIAFLLKHRSGEAVGALNHHSVGEISLVWGNKKAGLEKIADKHPEVLDNLQEIIDGMEVVEESANRIKLESPTHYAVVSKEWFGQPRDKWLLTAYEKKETPKPLVKTMDTGEYPEDLQGDTALSQNSDVSEGKGNASESDLQEEGTALSRIPKHPETGKPMFEAADVAATYDALVESGSEGSYPKARLKAAKKELKKAQKLQNDEIDYSEHIKRQSEIDEARRRAQGAVDYWEAVIAEGARRVEEAARAEKERMAEERRQQQEELERRKAEEEAKKQEIKARKRAEQQEKKEIAGRDRELREAYERCKGYDDALEVLADKSPRNIYEAASVVLAGNKLLWGNAGDKRNPTKRGMAYETGYGNGERLKMFGKFARAENGGKSIRELSELPMKEVCDTYGIPYDEHEAVNALLEVLQSVSTPSGLTYYIRDNRIKQALEIVEHHIIEEDEQEREYLYRLAKSNHLSSEEYEAYQEQADKQAEDALRNFDEQEYMDRVADDLAQRGEIYYLKDKENAEINGRGGSNVTQTEGGSSGTELEMGNGEQTYSSGTSEAGRGESRGDEEAWNRGAQEGGDLLRTQPEAEATGGIEAASAEPTEVQKPRYGRTVPPTPEAQRSAIAKIVEFAKKVKNRVERAVIGGITKRQAKDLAEHGIEVDDSWVHSFESSAVLHNQKHHGNEKIEEARGQIAITPEDYARIPEILENYDKVSKSSNKTKGTENDVIVYEKEFNDGYVYYLEEKRDNRKSLAFQTMYKKKKGTDSSDGFSVKSTAPITPLATPDNLSSSSEGKGNASLSEKQVPEGESLGEAGNRALENRSTKSAKSAMSTMKADGANDARSTMSAKSAMSTMKADEAPLSVEDFGAGDEEASMPEKHSDAAESEKNPRKRNKWISDEDAAEFDNLRNALRSHLGADEGIVKEEEGSYGRPLPKPMDAEMLRMGTRMTYMMMKGGLRKFSDYAEAMIEEVGDGIRPHLKSLYAAVQNIEEVMQLGWDEEMDDRKTVKAFDVYNFDKAGALNIAETAQHAAEETASQKATEKMIEGLKDERKEKMLQREGEKPIARVGNESIVDLAKRVAADEQSRRDSEELDEYDKRTEELAHTLDFESEDLEPQDLIHGIGELQTMWEGLTSKYGEDPRDERIAGLLHAIETEIRRWREKEVVAAESRSAVENAVTETEDKASFPAQTPASNEKKPTTAPRNVPQRGIQDWGEEILGARKDALKEFARKLDNISVADLVSNPLSKVFKATDWKKLADNGELPMQDAILLEAITRMILCEAKPKPLTRNGFARRRREQEITEWAEKRVKQIEALRRICEAETPQERDAAIAELDTRDIDSMKEERQRLIEMNPGYADGGLYPPNEAEVMTEILNGLGYPTNEVGKAKFATIGTDRFGTSYEVKLNGKYYGRYAIKDDAIAACIKIAKASRGDTDVEYTPADMAVSGRTVDRRKTGKWRIETLKGYRIDTVAQGLSEDEAKAKMDELQKRNPKKAYAMYEETEGVVAYSPSMRDPVTKERVTLEGVPEFETVAEARSWISDNIENLQDKANAAISARYAQKDTGKGTTHFQVEINRNSLDGKYMVWAPMSKRASGATGNMRVFASGFASYREAKKWVEDNQEVLDMMEAMRKEAIRKFTYFAPNEARRGKDYRGGRDVTEKELGETFGFRGVQFGNWTNQRDRQQSINEAYDALMDMADLLGLSPRAIGLNGELGLAFGARGSGNANAHYEPDNVVINLTKTRGAGSLAHEWWHAMDNYFARRGGMKTGMITEGVPVEVRRKVAEVFKELVDAVRGSAYDVRCRQRGGGYWDSIIEETARLFAEWVDRKLAERGGKNSFLSAGVGPERVEKFRKAAYNIYQQETKVLNESIERQNEGKDDDKKMPLIEVMSYADFRNSDRALAGFVYPLDSEISEIFDAPMRKLFDTIEEVEEDGSLALNEPAAEYGNADFNERQQRAASQRGAVLPGLGNKQFAVVEVSRHDFNSDKPIAQARQWAKKNLVGEYELTDESGNKVVYTISGRTINKFLSESSIGKSENIGVHLSVMKQLPEVIGQSIEVEVHPDYNKGADEVRRAENGYNENVLVHRLYGAVKIDGNTYRVKTTILENITVQRNKPHSFEVSNVELIEEPDSGRTIMDASGVPASPEGSISAAKLLNGVEKSYDKGVKLLDASEKSGNNGKFASRYETKDGKTINYTSENPEAYGGLFAFDFRAENGKGAEHDDGAGADVLQREGNPLYTGHGSRLNPETAPRNGKGEFCCVERVFKETGSFSFTGTERIESADDVAFIFSALEDAAKEHAFAVYVKDGKPTVVELGMGAFNVSIGDIPTASIAYSRIKPDEVYFVHNHPSGNLKCSHQDVKMLQRMKEMCDVPVHGVIINLKTGKYGTFGTDGKTVEGDKRTPEKALPLKVHTLDKQIFSRDYDPMAQPLVGGSHDVAAFLNSQRMGDRAKVSFLIVSQSGRIVGNIHTPYCDISTDIREKARYISEKVIQFGGASAILYGDFNSDSTAGSDYRKLKEQLRQVGDTRLLDVVSVDGNFTRSANDEGLLYEPENEYGNEERQETKKNPPVKGWAYKPTSILSTNGNGAKMQKSQSASSHNGQDLTTGSSTDSFVKAPAKITISDKNKAKEELNYLASKYKDTRKSRGFISDIAMALGENPANALQSHYFEFRDNAGNIYTLRLSNHNVNAENHKEATPEISIVVKSRRQPNRFNPSETADVTEYVYFKEDILKGDGQTLSNIAKDISGLLDTGEYKDTSGMAVVNHSPAEHVTREEKGEGLRFRIREEEPPRKTGVGYKVFVLKDGKLYPPMVANPKGEDTPVGVWLDADAAPVAGLSKTGRQQVKAGGKGTQGGSGKLAYRPGWHLGEIPYALQFNRVNPETGEKELFPANFVWAEVEYANDIDYQQEAMSYGYNSNGKFQHSYAGLPRVPENGSYTYRTNPNPETDPWIITGAMKVNRLLTPTEVDEMVRAAGREPQQRQPGAVTDADINALNSSNEKEYGAATSEEAKEDRVNELSEKLNTPVRVIKDVSDISDSSEAIQRRKRSAKGWYNPKTNEVVVVLPNNADVADVDNTVVHEIVGHKGLRALIGEDRFEEFLSEVYNHASDSIRRKIDEMTDRMVADEAERLVWDEIKDKPIAQAGFFRAAYDSAAKRQAEKKREQYRKEATEEYMSDLGGRIGSEGFEKMSRDELTFWGKIKAKVQEFLDKFLQGLRIPKRIVLRDKDLSYILYKSWKNMRAEKQTAAERAATSIVDSAEDAVMRHRTGWDKGMQVTEKKERIEKLRRSKPVEISGNEIESSDDIKQFKKNALEYGKNLQGEYINEDNGKTIQLQRGRKNGGLKEVLQHDLSEKAHIQSIAAIPDIIRKSIYIETQPNHDISKNPDVSGYEHYVCGLRIGGEDYTVHSIVAEDKQGNRYYDHKLSHIEKGKLLDFIEAKQPVEQILTPTSGTKPTIRSERKIKELISLLQVEDSDSEIRFRNGKDFVDRNPVVARAIYEKQLQTNMYQFTEAMQDSMRGLMEFYNAVERQGAKRKIENVSSFENAYTAENLLSSRNKSEMTEYENYIMRPLLDIAARIAGNKKGLPELTDYMMAKHGLERNDYMRSLKSTKRKDRDFAGLCGLTGEKDWQDAEAAAQKIVQDYEKKHTSDIPALWDAINKATKASLQKAYISGLLSKKQYTEIRDMYKYYIPLRGFDEATSGDMYGYLTSKNGAFGSPIKKAKGRSSKADDPFANIAQIANSCIVQGNRNVMKQQFLRYVQNHPSDLASINKLWLAYDDITDTWKPVTADLDEKMTPAEIEKAVEDFEKLMEDKSQKEPKKFKRGRDAISIPYRVIDGNIKEHQIIVKQNGESYVITINGNPRAAQAVNGLTNPDNDLNGAIGKIFNAAEYLNRKLSQVYTTANPDFTLSNFIRDLFYSNLMVHVKEDINYAKEFHVNHVKFNPITLINLLHKYETNQLNMKKDSDRLFYEFMHWGGETGYTIQRKIEEQKKHIKSMIADARRGNLNPRHIWNIILSVLDLINRGVENSARFAAFVTSRKEGRDIQRSVYDAKEISVNFNKKGAGSKFMDAEGQTTIGRIASFISGAGRAFYVFWNAGVQGLANYGKAFKKHPVKATILTTALTLLGYIMAALNDDGDDEDANGYYNIPKYKRRSNFMFKLGDNWYTIPLAVEFRAFYGLGELAYGYMSKREEYTTPELAKEISEQLSQILPLDFMEGGGGLHPFIPSAFKPVVEASMNKSWTGLPIYRDSPYNKELPAWTKSYSKTNAQLIDLAKRMNEKTGGNDYKEGWIDLNPAQMEYLLNGYFGGYSNVINKLVKTGEIMLGEREYDPSSILFVNRLVTKGDERTAEKKMNSDFYNYNEEYERTHRLIKNYEKEIDHGSEKYKIFLDALKNSRDGARHDIMDWYHSDYKWLHNVIKDPDTPDGERTVYEDEMRNLKKEVVTLMKVVNDSNKVNELKEQYSKDYDKRFEEKSESSDEEDKQAMIKFNKHKNKIAKKRLKEERLKEARGLWRHLRTMSTMRTMRTMSTVREEAQ